MKIISIHTHMAFDNGCETSIELPADHLFCLWTVPNHLQLCCMETVEAGGSGNGMI